MSIIMTRIPDRILFLLKCKKKKSDVANQIIVSKNKDILFNAHTFLHFIYCLSVCCSHWFWFNVSKGE